MVLGEAKEPYLILCSKLWLQLLPGQLDCKTATTCQDGRGYLQAAVWREEMG